MAAPMKKRKTTSTKETVDFSVKYPDVVIFIVERNIQRFRLDHIKKLARKKGFLVSDTLNESVTHIVSELETRDQVLEVLKQRLPNEVSPSLLLQGAEIISMGWFSSCMEEGVPVKVTHGHRLKPDAKIVPLVLHPLDATYQDAKYCCQRVNLLNHHNKKLTDALEVLEKQANFLGGDHNASRALAFCKASAALKALPRPVRSMHDVENLYDLKGGKHCKRVVQEILEEGFSSEVEDILNDEWFQTMKIFTGIFGCGAATSRKWFDMKLRNLEDVRKCPNVSLTTEQRYGLEFYDDINTPVTRQEAEAIQWIVAVEAQKILPGTTVTITGGFSRGKDTGHDVDLLISHPEVGKEEGVLTLILNALHEKGLLEYTDVQNSSYSEAAVRQVRRNQTMDHFERCFSIFRLPKHLTTDSRDIQIDSTHKREELYLKEETTTSSHESVIHTTSELKDAERRGMASGNQDLKVIDDGVESRHGLPLEEGCKQSESSLEFRNQSNITHTKTNEDPETEGVHVGTTHISVGKSSDRCWNKDEVCGNVNVKDSGRNLKIQSDDCMTGISADHKPNPRTNLETGREDDRDWDWVARRVDFIITPQSQYAYALMGWIGSRMFNRSARDYANKEMNMTLTSHGLFDKTKNVLLPAKTQREIFEHLKLEYREPHERNC